MLTVLLNGQVIGDLEGAGKRLRLYYYPDAIGQPEFVPLSTGMPATQPRWRGDRVANWLEGLLPEREAVLRRWRAQFGITDLHPESLLAHIGEDVAGAAQFVRKDRLESVLRGEGDLQPLSEAEVADLVRAAYQDVLPFSVEAATGQFSLAGAQAKFALQRLGDGWAVPAGAQPSTHIFKPAVPGFADQDVTEVLSMRLAAQVGLATAHAFVTAFASQRVIVVERYDRVQVRGQWVRVHQENLCQVAGLAPLRKYESQGGLGASACADLIRRHCGAVDVERFAQAVIYNYLVRGSDAHAQNYSLLITPSSVRLAPLYDLNSTLTFGHNFANEMAMRVGGETRFDRIGRADWEQFAREAGLEPEWVLSQLNDMAGRLPGALAEVRADADLAPFREAGAMFQDRLAEWLKVSAATRRHK
ncbi:MAG: type II toxin-antitoxin system HipA family toxin [Bifidobacteriaceae bacterium]|jgi:serine/threonine-protein kinase HipA|nr:type II toxin-antitoxin system HipA family toxin [Bifidobacteriaceae bacterium]